jgi:putative transposase
MTDRRQTKTYDLWARLRFSVIGHLLADPPATGTLSAEIAKLAEREWRHPVTGEPVRFGHSTIERWLYLSRRERQDPVGVLHRKPRHDAGYQASMTEALRRK